MHIGEDCSASFRNKNVRAQATQVTVCDFDPTVMQLEKMTTSTRP